MSTRNDSPTSVGPVIPSEASPSASPLVPLRAGNDAASPLFLVHPMDGRLDCYAELVRHAPASQPVVGIQARGLDDGRAPLESLEAMAVFYVEALRAERSEGPYHLAGWALGAVIAWEMARLLQRDGHVARLTLIEPPPASPDRSISAQALAAHAALFARELALQAGLPPLELPAALTTGKDPEPLLVHLHAEGTRQGLLPAATTLEFLRARFKLFSAHVRAARRYVPEAFAASARIVRAAEVVDAADVEKDKGWAVLAEEGAQVDDTPGDGHSLLREPHVKALAARLFESGQSLTGPIPTGHGDGAPLSYAQQRLWFLDQLQPGSPAYNMFYGLRFTGPLEHSLLERAFTELARRHQTLRTRFRSLQDGPVQAVSPPAPFTISVDDLRALPPEARDAEAQRLADAEARTPFDLATGPLLRARLLTLDEHEHVLLIVNHHVISDGWSIGVLSQEVPALYLAFALGRPSPLPELPVQYADFAVWQRGWLTGDVLESQLAYWRTQLADAPHALELPTDRPRPPIQSLRGDMLRVDLPAALAPAVHALCHQEGVTPFMVLLATYQTLLARYSGQDDIIVGSPIANRMRADLEGLIGFFANTLALRARFTPGMTFRELLAQVRETTLGAYAHQDVPFEKLVDELRPERDQSRTPLFQVMLALHNTPKTQGQEDPDAPLKVRPLDAISGTAKFDLSLLASDDGNVFNAVFEYNTDLFDTATVQRMADQFVRLLRAAVEDPLQPVWRLPMMEEPERRQVLVSWNDTSREPFAPTTLHAPVEAQALRTPDAIAVTDGTDSLTYAALDARANQLAHHLLARGVTPGNIVGICLDKSLDMAVAVLATLKVGASYVALDPSYPAERLAFMLADTRAPVVLTHSRLTPSLPADGGARVLLLDVDAAIVAGQSRRAPGLDVSAESPAYIIYTSGSTGVPKGIVMPHRALSALFTWQLKRAPQPRATTLQFASLNFDVSVQEMFCTWWAGGTLVLPTGGLRQDIPALLDFMQQQRVERLFLPFAALQAIADAVSHGATLPSALREVVTAGEQLQVSDTFAAFFAKLPGSVLENQYGPSEAHVVSAFRLQGTPTSWPRLPSIGGPVGHTRLYVLDALGHPVPIGVSGELYIGGTHLAHGYLSQPEVTAKAFVPDPFSTEPGARLHRTGDAARWRADGTLDFLGRLDSQVKLRGFRVELGEVESVLRSAPGLSDAAVIVREDVPGDRRLVGYVVVSPDATLDTEALRAFVLQRLPEYMLPSAFVALPALPLTPSGKLARKRLPAPDAESLRGGAAFAAPRTPLEEKLAALFADVLHVPRVSVTDNFFALGGHSLLATQVVSRVRSAFGVELPLRTVFGAPTVVALAASIDTTLMTSRNRQPPALVPVARTGPLPLSFAQQRLWFLDQLQPGGATYNMPSFVRLDGALHLAALQRAFAELVRRHEALRTTFLQQNDEPFQIVAPHAELPVTVVKVQGQTPDAVRQEVERLLREEYLRPFNLSTGPLVRALLLETSPTEHFLALNMHHIVSDGWSMGVLTQEVATLYGAFAMGAPSPLPPLSLQYADYAVWQRDWLQGEVLEQQLAWWRGRLMGVATLDLPLDKPRPPVQTFTGAQVLVTLRPEVSKRLKTLCQREGITPFMALLAAWQLLLSRHTGQDDIAVGSPIAGRQRAELEGLIGFFVNTLVFRARIDTNATFLQLLRQVKETALGAYAHQDVPFERLVEEFQIRRDLSRSPLFQVLFALQNTPASALQKQELSLSPVEVEATVIKFELELHFVDGPDGLFGALTYNTDLFERASIERMTRHFELLVEAVVARPDAPLATHSMLTVEERRDVLTNWASAPALVSPDSTLPAVFADVVARAPDSVALLVGDTSLTYRQLDERSNQLAWHLRSLGVRTDSRVAIAVDRSAELIIALVAILKAGAAYVPLDTKYPRERLASMMEDARPEVLVSTRAFLDKLPTDGLACVLLDEVSLAHSPTRALPPSALPASLAYIDFTSGSTGKPKGVGCTHSGVIHILVGVDYTRFGPEQTHLLLAPISFDATTFEIWGALLHGARLVVLPPQAPSLEELFQTVARHGVTTLWATSGLFSQLVESRLPAPPSLQRVLTGGDIVSPLHVRRALQDWGVSVTNCYGPTETTVFATTFLVARLEDVGATVPIGKPTNGTRLLVLDSSLQPVPIGITGELFIGGDGLARGYVGQPSLTAERFIPDPFSSVPGARLYRSGDLVRWSHDGTLAFIGRADAQVKVRGFRIELPEVEAAMLAHPSIRDAIAIAREDVPGDKRLVGYFVGDDLDAVSLRAFLKSRLPEYMVPSSLLRLDALPLTANAKIDRKALPPPEAVLSAPSSTYVAPRTPTEELLASIWAQVLRVPQVGIEDDFFALGGHSLLATQLVSRIRNTFKVELALRELFEAPTIEALARRLDAATLAGKGTVRPPLVLVPRTGELPLSFAQQRLWLIDQLEPGSSTYNIPLALLLQGPLEVDALQGAFTSLVERHESLRTTFVTHDGEPRQHIHAPKPMLVTVRELESLSEDSKLVEARRLVSEEASRPFDLEHGPIFRVLLLRLDAQRHVLVGTVHHIASDGWSTGI
ncbi:non-ribosomal peptide synthetase, partial [Myxococcus sp. CA040A]|uniref:non-ribosomal peptide synthetase n=1 Tax=Myxococcus sp. CA040A TaxID=2741738 RepID=UPI00157A5548|nr:amino acid adenylation domain-containing protein [Myxococcus sp. CA040A]